LRRIARLTTEVTLLSAKRVREALSLFASLLAVVAIVSAAGVSLLGLLDAAAANGVRADLAMRPGAELALRLSQLEGADPVEQDRAVRAVIESEFRSSGRSIPLEIDRTLAGEDTLEYTLLGDSPEQDGRVMVASVPALGERASIVDGAWPAAEGEASIQADAAALLGLAVGDRIRLGDAEFVITGSWRVDEGLDPVWAGESVMIAGADDAIVGPIVVDGSAWPLIGESPDVRWTVVPDAASISAHELDAIDAAWSTLIDAMDQAGIGATPFAQDGGFSLTANELSARVHALDAVKPIALLIIAAIALVTLLELGRLLTEIREFELELLWSRGATAGELARTTAVESTIVSLLGAGLGAGTAAGILSVLGGVEAVTAAGSALWAFPLATVLVAVIALAAQTYRATRRGARRDNPERSGRVQRVAGLGVVVLVTLAAAVSVWQLQLYGTPVTPVAGGGTAVDPVTVVAPALALVSLVLIGLLAFPRIAPLAERAAERRFGADHILAARSVARRLTLVATPIVLVALACGQFVIAGGYAATWESSFTRAQELRAGTSTRVTTPFVGLPDALLDQITAVDGVTAVAPVYTGELKAAGEYASVIGVAPRALADLAATADGMVDPAALADTIDVGLSLPALPGGEGDLSVTIASSGFLEQPRLSVWIGDEFGQLRHIQLEPAAASAETSTVRYSAPLPTLVGSGNAWHLTAVDVAAIGADAVVSHSESRPRAEVVAIERDGEPVELGGTWSAFGFGEVDKSLEATKLGHGTTLTVGITLARLLTTSEVNGDPLVNPVPVAISSTLAERIGVKTGTVLLLPLVARTMPVAAVIADVVDGIPGAPNAAAVLVDSGVLDSLRLRTFVEPTSSTLHWIGTADPRSVGDDLRHALPSEVAVDVLELDPDRDMLGSGAIALWMAAGGSALLALAALGAVAGAQLRGRRGEVIVLRAIGMGSRQQGWIRRREFALVAGYGSVIGVIAGVVAVLVTIAPLARSAVPDSYPEMGTTPMFAPVPLALTLGGLLVLVAGTIVVYAAQVAAQARTPGGQEVVR
jgi:hypothetical protein